MTSKVLQADLYFKGWWDTLGWKYYKNELGKISYEEINSWYGREIGEDNRPMCAQQIQQNSGTDWDAYYVYLRIRKFGAPVTDVRVDFMSDVAGLPGVSLANCVLGQASFEQYHDWVEFELSVPVTMVSGTSYWIQAQKAGAISVDNCYIVDCNDTAGYLDGTFKVWNTTSAAWENWGSRKLDMNFKVEGRTETTTQIETMITNEGQFMAGTDLVDASGVFTNSNRRGDNKTLYEAEKLLNMGTSNNLRLLARVLPTRIVQVYEEPPRFEADYSKDAQGIIKDAQGAVVSPADCPVGVWMTEAEIVPTTVDTSKLSAMDYSFVEEATYTPRTNTYQVKRARGEDRLRSMFGVSDG